MCNADNRHSSLAFLQAHTDFLRGRSHQAVQPGKAGTGDQLRNLFGRIRVGKPEKNGIIPLVTEPEVDNLVQEFGGVGDVGRGDAIVGIWIDDDEIGKIIFIKVVYTPPKKVV